LWLQDRGDWRRATDHPEVDEYLTHGFGTNEFESLLLAGSPLDVFAAELNLEPSEYSYPAHRQRVLYSFDELSTLHQEPSPIFVFAHIISPHPPFGLNRFGQPVRRQ
jgi:hypothetical protein